jgi:hypothetical protein
VPGALQLSDAMQDGIMNFVWYEKANFLALPEIQNACMLKLVKCVAIHRASSASADGSTPLGVEPPRYAGCRRAPQSGSRTTLCFAQS